MLDDQTNAPPGSAGWAIPHRGAADDARVAWPGACVAARAVVTGSAIAAQATGDCGGYPAAR
jgi:hypothetical protein